MSFAANYPSRGHDVSIPIGVGVDVGRYVGWQPRAKTSMRNDRGLANLTQEKLPMSAGNGAKGYPHRYLRITPDGQRFRPLTSSHKAHTRGHVESIRGILR